MESSAIDSDEDGGFLADKKTSSNVKIIYNPKHKSKSLGRVGPINQFASNGEKTENKRRRKGSMLMGGFAAT